MTQLKKIITILLCFVLLSTFCSCMSDMIRTENDVSKDYEEISTQVKKNLNNSVFEKNVKYQETSLFEEEDVYYLKKEIISKTDDYLLEINLYDEKKANKLYKNKINIYVSLTFYSNDIDELTSMLKDKDYITPLNKIHTYFESDYSDFLTDYYNAVERIENKTRTNKNITKNSIQTTIQPGADSLKPHAIQLSYCGNNKWKASIDLFYEQ